LALGSWLKPNQKQSQQQATPTTETRKEIAKIAVIARIAEIEKQKQRQKQGNRQKNS